MKRFALALSLLLPTSLHAADGQKVIDGYLEPAGCEQITEVSTAVGLTGPFTNVKIALIQAQGDDLRWRDDGTSPTATVGMLLTDGQTLVYNGNMSAIQLIETTADQGIVNVCLYR